LFRFSQNSPWLFDAAKALSNVLLEKKTKGTQEREKKQESEKKK